MFNYGYVYFYFLESVENESNEDVESIAQDSVTPKPLKKGRALLESGFSEMKWNEIYFCSSKAQL